MVKRIDAAARYAAVDKKVANALRKVSKGELFVKNKLSEKPAKAADGVRKFINNQTWFNISMKQNYSKNVVELDLLGRSYGVCPGHPEKNGYQVLHRKEIPVTAAVSTYTKAAKEMAEGQFSKNNAANSSNKEGLLDKIKNCFGI